MQRTAEGYLSYEFFYANQEAVYEIADVLLKRFQFGAVRVPINGLDCVFWDWEKGAVRLTVGWDIWSGCFVMAHCDEGNTYVGEVANALKTV